MELVGYLGRHLKDDAVIELLEAHDLDVVYHFDRLHENTADFYRVSAKSVGFALRFNGQQLLDTVWCYILGRDGFAPVDTTLIGVPCHMSCFDAKNVANTSGETISEPPAGSPMEGKWILLKGANHWAHYEFNDRRLALVTLTLPRA